MLKFLSQSLKYLFISFLAVTLAVTPAVALASQAEVLTAIQVAQETVVKLTSADPNDGSSCSAVIVAPNMAATAAHCIDIPQLQIVFDNGKTLLVDGIAVAASGQDMALLRVPGLECPCAEVITQVPVKGEQAVAIGYPHGIMQVTTAGLIQGRITSPDDNFTYLVSTTIVAPGNSGGGLFIFQDGKPYLAGIVVVMVEGLPYLAGSVELAVEDGSSNASER